MKISSKSLVPCVAAALSLLGGLLSGPAPAIAQGVVQDCVDRGFKPGTAGFYHCLQTASASESSELQSSEDNDTGSNLESDADSAAADVTGSTMEGATAPDPDILKQLNGGPAPGR